VKYDYTVFDLRVPEIPSPEASRKWMEGTLKKIGATVLGYLSKDFESSAGHAYTQLWVLAESHAIVHTSPEEGWAEIVFAFCKPVATHMISDEVKEFWKPAAMDIQTMTGKVPDRGWKRGARGSMSLGEEYVHNPDSVEKLLFQTKSPYQEIMLTQLPDKEVALYLDGGIQFVSGHDDQVYHWTLATAPALMVGKPRNALILGGGDGLAARNLFEFPSIQKVTQIELDPIVTKFSETHSVMRRLNKDSFRNPKMDLRIMDARKFVASKPKEKFDVILVDFTDPLDHSMADLYSSPFYGNLYDHLSMEGVMAVQSSAAYSDVDEAVHKNLMKATDTLAKSLRFRGKWMADGTITVAGKGVKHEFQMPKGLEPVPPAIPYKEMPDGMRVF